MDHDPFYFSDLAILTRPAKGLKPDNVKNIKGAADSSTEGKVDKRNANQAISFIPGRIGPPPHLMAHSTSTRASRPSSFTTFKASRNAFPSSPGFVIGPIAQ